MWSLYEGPPGVSEAPVLQFWGRREEDLEEGLDLRVQSEPWASLASAFCVLTSHLTPS